LVTDTEFGGLRAFQALADPTRRQILAILREGMLSAGELARRFPVSRPAVSRHVRVLRDAGLVRQSRDKQTLRYSIDPAPLAAIDRWLNDYRVFWGARLTDLKRHVEETEATKN
jgi:DNA-binding transcriptional ArsR family regulator